MSINILDLGRKIINFINMNCFSILDTKSYRAEYIKNIVDAVDKKVFGQKGINDYQNNKLYKDEMEIFLKRSVAQYLSTKSLPLKNIFLKLAIKFIFYILFIFIFCYVLFLYFKDVYISYSKKLFNLSINLHNKYNINKFCSKSKIKQTILDNKSEKNFTDAVMFYHYDYLEKSMKNLFADENRKFTKEVKMHFTFADLVFFIKCFKYYPKIIFYPDFIFSVIKWISIYSMFVKTYNPKKITGFMDGTFISSLMTYYLNEKGIQHVNCMHGEMFYYPRWAFSKFDIFYVYGNYWSQVYKRLNCEAEFRILENEYYCNLYKLREKKPIVQRDSLLILHNQILEPNTKEYLLLLKILKLLPKNVKIHFRYHPNEKPSGVKFFEALKQESNRYGFKVNIDPNQSLQIHESISHAKFVIGRTTTALMEGWIAGCKVIYLNNVYDLQQRYGGSQNVLFVGDNTLNEKKMLQFLHTPVIENDNEKLLLNNVFFIKI